MKSIYAAANESGVPLPKGPVYLIGLVRINSSLTNYRLDFNLMSVEFNDIEIEKKFFQDNPHLGRFVQFMIFGTTTSTTASTSLPLMFSRRSHWSIVVSRSWTKGESA